MNEPDFTLDGQAYWHVGERPHVTQDGRMVTLGIWRTRCADCGVETLVTSTGDRGPQTRRCEDHRTRRRVKDLNPMARSA